ncbi:mucin-2 [Elgaria multicarinata webbii]|uniref:mucin-2 n=1 Tax=Elgaria multicarinata webbii TaxID=159646 RepID=UPI002FCD20EB
MGLRLASLLILWLAICNASEIRKGRSPNHDQYVCSTWGNNHFKTFDGDFYQFPGVCDYNFVSDCRESYKEFSVHIQRELNDQGHPDIQYVLVTIKDVAIYLSHKMVVVDGQITRTPYHRPGILIEKDDKYSKVYSKVGLVLIWNRNDALMVELDSKFQNYTCGLCGDYNGLQIYNEFISNGLKYNPIIFGNLQKINNPQTVCEDPDEAQTVKSCNLHREECEKLLTSPAFADCQSRLNLEQYIQACMQDRCACQPTEDSFCLCSTISEFSRQCSHAGGKPQNWRTAQLCPESCPGNMVYLESASPCMDTCSHLEISKLCEEHYMDGCFCPEGTVYDDITGKGCVSTSQCYCKLHGKLFAPGQDITNECENCTCASGRWICQDLPCPSTCAVEGGTHITTFDGKKYIFHGDCYYVLAKTSKNDSHVLLGELGPCSSTEKQTCLKTVVLLTDHRKNVVVFKSDGTVLLNELEIHLPHKAASFSVFQPSSYYIIVQTSFGLKLQIQLSPVMQLFAVVDQSVKGILQGLCGNFNGIASDDFKTSGGLVEATGASFANTWKAQASCPDKLDNWENPCTLSLEHENYAEHWCSLLKSTQTLFARCHSVLDPTDYYKRCKYDTCSCNSNEECLCAALSSYARACAFKGVMLWGWRNDICNKEVSSCPATQVFRYNLTTCQRSCRSLSDGDKHCLEGFTPVDGCGCPDNTYMNDKGTCVPISQCPCYYKDSFVQPGSIVMKQEERCTCKNGRFHCRKFSVIYIYFTECLHNKTYFDCNNISSWWSPQTPVQLSCQTLGTEHFQRECISGCVCPEGLIDDGRDGCVKEEDCPCIHNNDFYSPGDKIKVDCNTCTCQKGSWRCTNTACYGTCNIYGSGHFITFDGKFYDFDGSCDYVATQDYCGNKSAEGTFSVITENVPCGNTGVTCSKAIKLFLGNIELKLEEKKIEKIVQNNNSGVTYWIREQVGLYIVVEVSSGIMLIWDKKTTIFIKLTPHYKGKVCGLCGNFDDMASNDFTTRSMVQVTSTLTFGNSWKMAPSCPDVEVDIQPCEVRPHRRSWAEKECSIIKSKSFEKCHYKVDPEQYYEACVHDACACDSGGDCECFCTAVAAYAQECIKAGACIHWRTPEICPIFCDYYNPSPEICEWHYEPCGRDILSCKVLTQVNTNFSLPFLEGCYPRCPPETPIFNEETSTCVTEVECTGCYFEDVYYPNGALIPTYKPRELCQECFCVRLGTVDCKPKNGCCIYEGEEYNVGDIILERNGSICFELICTLDGLQVVHVHPCSTTVTPTTTVSTTSSTTITTTTPPCICEWSQWYDVSFPKDEPGGGDYETYDAIRNKGYELCAAPLDIHCRAKASPDLTLEELGQKVDCNVTHGFICRNDDQDKSLWNLCYNYEISVFCCPFPCSTTTGTTSPTTSPTTTKLSTTPPTTTTPASTTTMPPTTTPTIIPTTTSTPTTTLITTPAPSTTTPTISPTTTTTITTTTITTTRSTTAPCPETEICEWSGWIDVSYPIFGSEYGDYETYDNIRAHGIEICERPQNISCRAEKFPDRSIKDLEQDVTCDVSIGLICNNKDQVPGTAMPAPMCLNYQIRVYCCICPPPQNNTTTPTTTTTSTSPTTTPTITPTITSTPTTTPISTSTPSTTTPTITPTITSTPTTAPISTSTPSTTTPTISPTTTATTPHSTTVSSPEPAPCPETEICEWSGWIDVSYPIFGSEYGDYETYDNIRAHGIEICERPQNISCRAEKFPDRSIKDLEQDVTCDVSTGLICNNKDQVPGTAMPAPMCLNYQIRVYCCICPTTTPTTTTTSTSPTTTLTITPTITSTPTTTPISTSTPSTTTPTITPTVTSTPTTTPISTSTPSTTTPTISPTTTATTPHSTTVSSPEPAPCPETEICEWSGWIDVSYPIFGSEYGDYETYDNIRAHGIEICERPQNISCRAEKFPDRSIKDLEQDVTCDVSIGLICNNKDQVPGTAMPAPMCLNYQIRVYCCICPTTTPTTTTTSTSPTTTLTITPTITSTPTTTPISTSTPSTTTPTITPTVTSTPTTTPISTSTPSTTTPTISPTTTATTPHSTTEFLTIVASTPTSPSITGTQTPSPTAPTSTQTPSTTTTQVSKFIIPACYNALHLVFSNELHLCFAAECIMCYWSSWISVSKPNYNDKDGGDNETYVKIREEGIDICTQPLNISCRAKDFPHVPLEELGQELVCDVSTGLICKNKDQIQGGVATMCLDYEISVECCGPCVSTTTGTSTTPVSTPGVHSSTTTATTTIPCSTEETEPGMSTSEVTTTTPTPTPTGSTTTTTITVPTSSPTGTSTTPSTSTITTMTSPTTPTETVSTTTAPPTPTPTESSTTTTSTTTTTTTTGTPTPSTTTSTTTGPTTTPTETSTTTSTTTTSPTTPTVTVSTTTPTPTPTESSTTTTSTTTTTTETPTPSTTTSTTTGPTTTPTETSTTTSTTTMTSPTTPTVTVSTTTPTPTPTPTESSTTTTSTTTTTTTGTPTPSTTTSTTTGPTTTPTETSTTTSTTTTTSPTTPTVTVSLTTPTPTPTPTESSTTTTSTTTTTTTTGTPTPSTTTSTTTGPTTTPTETSTTTSTTTTTSPTTPTVTVSSTTPTPTPTPTESSTTTTSTTTTTTTTGTPTPSTTTSTTTGPTTTPTETSTTTPTTTTTSPTTPNVTVSTTTPTPTPTETSTTTTSTTTTTTTTGTPTPSTTTSTTTGPTTTPTETSTTTPTTTTTSPTTPTVTVSSTTPTPTPTPTESSTTTTSTTTTTTTGTPTPSTTTSTTTGPTTTPTETSTTTSTTTTTSPTTPTVTVSTTTPTPTPTESSTTTTSTTTTTTTTGTPTPSTTTSTTTGPTTTPTETSTTTSTTTTTSPTTPTVTVSSTTPTPTPTPTESSTTTTSTTTTTTTGTPTPSTTTSTTTGPTTTPTETSTSTSTTTTTSPTTPTVTVSSTTPTPTPTPTESSTTTTSTTTTTTTGTPTPSTTTSTTTGPTTTPTETSTSTSTTTTTSPTTPTVTVSSTTPTPTPTPTESSTTTTSTTTTTTTTGTPTPSTTTSTTTGPTTTPTETSTTTSTTTTTSPTTPTVTVSSTTPTPTPTPTESSTTTTSTTTTTTTGTPTPSTTTSTTTGPTTTPTETSTSTSTTTTTSPTTPTVTVSSTTPTPTPTPTESSTTTTSTTTTTTTTGTPTPSTTTSTTTGPTTTPTETSTTTPTTTTTSPTTPTVTVSSTTPTPTPTPTESSTTTTSTTTTTTTTTGTPTPSTTTSTTTGPTTTPTETSTTTSTTTTTSPTTPTVTVSSTTPTPTPTESSTTTTSTTTTTTTGTPTPSTSTSTTTGPTTTPTETSTSTSTTTTTSPTTPTVTVSSTTPTPTPTESSTTTTSTTTTTTTGTPTPSTTTSTTTGPTTTPTETSTSTSTTTTTSPTTPTVTVSSTTPTPTPTPTESSTTTTSTTTTTTTGTPTPSTTTSTTTGPTTTPTETSTTTSTTTTTSPTTPTVTVSTTTPTPTPTESSTTTTSTTTTTTTTTTGTPTPSTTTSPTTPTSSPSTTTSTTEFLTIVASTPTSPSITGTQTPSPTAPTSTQTPSTTTTDSALTFATTATKVNLYPVPTLVTLVQSSKAECIMCYWSSWISVSKPNYNDKDGGDNETYVKIREEGIDICTQPLNISCRAKDFPHVPLEELGQELVCDVSTGLICKNKDQIQGGVTTMCLDYEISVYCCGPCVSTTTGTPTTPVSTPGVHSSTTTATTTIPCSTEEPEPGMSTSEVTTTTTIQTPTTTPTPTPTGSTTTITSTPTPPTTPGTTTQSTTTSTTTGPTTTPTETSETIEVGDHRNVCYLANCSLWCEVEFHYWDCTIPTTTTTVPTTTTIMPTTNATELTILTRSPTTAIPPTLPVKKPCLNGTVQPGETGWFCDCVQAICDSDDKWVLVPVPCIPPPKPECSNGRAPVHVPNEDGCCWHWECDCYCTGWGDPHYVTFDGQYYSFQGNCTYTLVEEITQTVDNFGVYIDNYHCDAREPVSCPRTLIVKHETLEVRLTTVRLDPMKLQVLVNGQTVALPLKKYGVKVYESGLNHVVEIPALRMNVTYNGLSFTIKMPYQLFGNNTQGQCGTCTNDTADDCMLRSGAIIDSCEVMAYDWVVDDPTKPECPHLPPSLKPTVQPPDSCKPSPLCELLKESVFQKCHAAVDPENFYKACSFDSCVMPVRNIECASLQIYAATCADQGVCIDWRGHTNGSCPAQCPSNKVYKACGPSEVVTCKSGVINQTQQIEGCFCPEGTTLYDTGVDVCVKTCGCVGPDNIPRKFGENFQFDCKDCVCLEGGNGIICEPHKCPATPDKTPCVGEGFYTLTEVNPDDKCCSETVCVCNTSNCSTPPPQCAPGFETVTDTPTGHCCPVHRCVAKGVCVDNGNEYKPGSQILGQKCQQCVCTKQQDNSTQLNIIHCDHVPCNVKCETGYSLTPQPGECCGKCVQTSCVIQTSEEVLILNPAEQKSDPKDNCTIYTCMRINTQLISSTSVISCSPFNEERCQPGTITLLPSGCCKTCIPSVTETTPACSPAKTMDYILYDGCRSEEPISVTQCEGRCETSSIYSADANSMKHMCSCCRESKTVQKEITLVCPDGKNKTHSYLHVESCECLTTECTESQSSNTRHTQRRRSSEQTSTEPSKEKDEQRARNHSRRAVTKKFK